MGLLKIPLSLNKVSREDLSLAAPAMRICTEQGSPAGTLGLQPPDCAGKPPGLQNLGRGDLANTHNDLPH